MRFSHFLCVSITSLFTFCLAPQFSLLHADENDLQFWESPIPEQPQLIKELVQSAPYKEQFINPVALKFLVQVDEGKLKRQWIVSISSPTKNAENKEHNSKSITYYTSTGDAFEFSTRPETLLVKTLGPIKEKHGIVESSKLKKTIVERIEVPIDFLELGFNNVSEFALTLQKKERTFSFNIADSPFPSETTDPNSKAAEEIGITKNQLRSICATAPAYNAFFDLMKHTPGLKNIMKEMIDTPSLFSILKNGVNINFASRGKGIRVVNPLDWGLEPNKPCYSNPVTIILNKKPALNVRLIVTDTNTPYNLSAGVVGLVASSLQNPERLLFVRLLNTPDNLGESD